MVALVAIPSALLEWHSTHESHGSYWWTGSPGFDLLYGFIGCVVIVLFSKVIGSVWLQRSEDYYQDEEP